MRLGALLAEPGVEEVLVLEGPVGFLALHGGGQERDRGLEVRLGADAELDHLAAQHGQQIAVRRIARPRHRDPGTGVERA